MMDHIFSACLPPPLRVTEIPQQLLLLPPLTVASQPSSPFAQPLAMVAATAAAVARPTTPSLREKKQQQYDVIKTKQDSHKPWKRQQQQLQQQRRVRFHPSLVTKRVEATPEAASYSPWWSEHSLRKIQKRNKLVARHYQQPKNIAFCHAIERFMETTVTITHDDDNNNDKTNNNNKHYLNIILKTSSQTRGLERLIVPSVAASRRQTTRAVLRVQRRLRQAGVVLGNHNINHKPNNKNKKDMAAAAAAAAAAAQLLLRQTSLMHSQPCRQLAHCLAQIDEWEVMQMNK